MARRRQKPGTRAGRRSLSAWVGRRPVEVTGSVLSTRVRASLRQLLVLPCMLERSHQCVWVLI